MSRFAAVLLTVACFALLAAPCTAPAKGPVRGIPEPLPGHPGNIFLEGEEVVIPAETSVARWRVVDFGGKSSGEGTTVGRADRISLGKLGVGWYRVEFVDAAGKQIGWTTAAVLAGLKAAVPEASPVCTDSATAWFAQRYEDDQKRHQEILASLAALAGANWIRDRLAWGAIEPERGKFAADTIYDSSASLQAKHGLNVLDVFHSTPGWAIDRKLDGDRAWNRFPRDLRDHYAFSKAMAGRFKGRIRAWEPWNEANIDPFGGHTIDEMCSLQKAAYLGFKAGDPEVTVCWNVFAGSGSPLHTDGVIANETWPYFETYNIHSYSPPDRYLAQFETARRGACGRPIWISECGIRLTTDDRKPWGDLAAADDRKQAEFIAQSYASSLFAGVQRHFFFILGNYIEREVQFGILRHDHTPRPGYVALAAVGRFLAGARCLGRVSPTVYAFLSRPDGHERVVLVAWGEGAPWPLAADVRIEAVYDFLGRFVGRRAPSSLGPEAVFVLLPPDESGKLPLEAPPASSPRRDGEPSPVVMQLSLPAETIRLAHQSHAVTPGVKTELPLLIYNFGHRTVSGTLKVEAAPPDCRIHIAAEPVEIEPLGCQKVEATATVPQGESPPKPEAWIRVRGDFGAAGQPVLAFRLESAAKN